VKNYIIINFSKTRAFTISGFSLCFILLSFQYNASFYTVYADTNPCQKVVTPMVIHNEFPEMPNSSVSLTCLVTMVYYVSVRDGQIPQITQVAAPEARDVTAFNVYVKPTIPISETAQQVTGIRMVGNTMQVKGSNAYACPVCEALMPSCEWLECFDNVVLVAHNGRRFDFPVLITACENVRLCDRLFHCVSGCADSLPVFNKVFAGRTSYKHDDIADRYCNGLIGSCLQCT